MTGGPGTKPTLEQLEHLRLHHIRIEVHDGKVQITYVCSCGDKDCTVPETLQVYVCPRPPCNPTG